MIESDTENHSVEAQYDTEYSPLDHGRVLHFRLLLDGQPLSWSGVIRRWQGDESFRRFFISILADVSFPAYFWETQPVTKSTLDQDFEFVIVEARQLAGVPTDKQAFASHFSSAQAGSSVIEFPNLGGDASLVVPCPLEPLSAYSEIASFARNAPSAQQHQLWKMVAATLERKMGTQPVWLNTSGTGIYWLHVRLDSTPKYYTHAPYRIP